MGKLIFSVLIGCFLWGLFLSNMYCQELYPVRGTVFIIDGKPTKVNLLVESNDNRIKVPVDTKGNFIVLLDWGKEYKFYFSRIGYVSKCVEFSTILPSGVSKENIYPYELLVELFPIYPNVDTVFFKKPIARIEFAINMDDFDYNLDYQLSIQRKAEQKKNEYYNWKNKQAKVPKESKSVTEEITNTELSKDTTITFDVKPKLQSKEKNTIIISRKTNIKNNNSPFGLPPLKNNYPLGKTVEVHNLKGKIITRVIIKTQSSQKIYYMVKHNWGGLYYFVQETPVTYRSISKSNFEKNTNM
jgi:hypothetical protein